MESLNSQSKPERATISNYLTLQKNLDEVIGKIGLCRTIELVKSFIDNSSIGVNETEKFKLIATYIIAQTIRSFDLKEDDFYTSKIREYRDARMACFHLLKRYTDCSYAKIGEAFEQKKRNILYFCQKCDEMLSIPDFYPVFTSRYKRVEDQVLLFISKLP
ncbi:hypothetical protein [Flavilitoribacter nigricans]|uniref:Chromosomal replication initiator DnaA C-terminal domain-containing protein n=1 Tax=Flavilitoribacter nigricans (strain ATCC 23147 / DSM 23189 / NBRC 102662 / NCIMB 1420 / SS-2) TaxID=1122177 RepID=A0A2D0NKF4_FLAN2|nr:hypothetical protein [Flavilitoribacter nigricans]PHN08689.1 hypothetical protein CRP01_01900 [Flavilitoribacter nigricans DSM 23189 = NBRC 102662]